MRYEQAVCWSLFALVLLGGCRKDTVNGTPHVHITAPADGAGISVPDTLLVTVEATDDIGLTQVAITLLNAQNIPVTASASASVSGTSATRTLAMPLLSEHLESGTYTLLATASDGSLTGTDFQQLQVTGAPLRLRAVYTLVQAGAGTVALYRTDSLGQTGLATSWPMDLAGAAISSESQRLFVAGGATGNLLALHPDDASTAWQLPNQSSIGAPWFTSVDLGADGLLYVGMDNGTLRGYETEDGGGAFTATLADQYRTVQAVTVGSLVLSAERHFVTQERRLAIYYRSSGALQQAQALGLDPVGIFDRGDDHVLLFGNQDGQGHVQDRSIPDGGGWEPYTWPSSITAVAQLGNGSWLVALASGDLQRFTFSNASSISIASTPVLHHLAPEPISGMVYGAAEGQVLQINPTTGATALAWNVNGTALRVLPLYNR
jgi:outer membrane protein assembly factor BamB